jgi:hypothetical protein
MGGLVSLHRLRSGCEFDLLGSIKDINCFGQDACRLQSISMNTTRHCHAFCENGGSVYRGLV